MLEAKNSIEKETMLDKVSSDEDFFREHLNRTFSVGQQSIELVKRSNVKENPNLIAIATYEQSARNSAEMMMEMRSTSSRPSHQKCEARLGNHSLGSGSMVVRKVNTPPPATLK